MADFFSENPLLDPSSVYAMTFGYTREKEKVVLVATPNEMVMTYAHDTGMDLKINTEYTIAFDGQSIDMKSEKNGLSLINNIWIKSILGNEEFITKEGSATEYFFNELCDRTFTDSEFNSTHMVYDFINMYTTNPCIFTDESQERHVFYATPAGVVESIDSMAFPCGPISGQFLNSSSGVFSSGKALTGGLLGGTTGAIIGGSMGKKITFLYQLTWVDYLGQNRNCLIDVKDKSELNDLIKLNQVKTSTVD